MMNARHICISLVGIFKKRGKRKKLKLQYPTVTARLHAEIDEKITISFEVKKFSYSKIFKVENIF